MASWMWLAGLAAVLYGLHQVFTKLASGHIGMGVGGLVVEATAVVTSMVALREPPSLSRVAGMLLSVAGLYLLRK